MTNSTSRWRSIDPWLCGLVGLYAAVYRATLLSRVGYSGDTAKFQFLGHVPGTAHEPGAPTYLLALEVFDHLFPFGTPAFRASLLSAIFAILTLVMINRILRRLEVSRFHAATGAALLGATPVFWSQAVIAELYTLHALFLSVILWAFIRWRQEGSVRLFAAGCAATALSFGNHLTTITVVPALAVLVYRIDPRTFIEPRRLAIATGCILVGASQYLLLFIRAASPTAAYVEMAPTDLSSFMYYIAGGQFTGQWYPYSWAWVVFVRLPVVAGFFWHELGLLILPAAAGIALIRDREVRLFLILAAAGTVAFSAGYVIHDVYIYYLPVYMVGAIGYGVAAQWLVRRMTPAWKFSTNAVMILLPLVGAAGTWPWVDQSRSSTMERHAREALTTVSSNAVLVTPDYDYAAVLWYLTIGEGMRDRELSVFHLHSTRDFESSSHEYAWRLSRYLRGQDSLWLPVERRSVPSDRSVYLFSPFMKPLPSTQSRSLVRLNPSLSAFMNSRDPQEVWVRTLGGQGLRLIPVTSDLQRIELIE